MLNKLIDSLREFIIVIITSYKESFFRRNGMELILGTVQFGTDYGITNKQGKTPIEEVKNILSLFVDKDGSAIDTAPSYGNAESILGGIGVENFDLITKTQHFTKDIIDEQDIAFLYETVESSLKALNVKKLKAILIHNVNDCYKSGIDKVFNALLHLKKLGTVEQIGASIYEVRDIEQIVKLNFPIDVIQIPMNVLNQSVVNSGWLSKLKERDVEIHARSIFLQGLLLADIDSLNSEQKEALECYFNELQIHNLSKLEGALLYINQIEEIDKVLIGVNNSQHLNSILEAKYKIQKIEHIIDFKKFAINNKKIIDPRRW